MRLAEVWLEDFRSYDRLHLTLGDGTTVLLGPNGVGKTNLVEAIGLLSTSRSFRGAATDSVIRRGADAAVVRAVGERDGREVLIEIELTRGRTRVQVNRQRVSRSSDLMEALRVTVFSPEDLAVVKEGPGLRRQFVDDLVVALDPRTGPLFSDLDRILRQRAALLRQAGGRLDDATAVSLDVWDTKLAATGDDVMNRRDRLLTDLMPLVGVAYQQLSSSPAEIVATLLPSWDEASLAQAIADARANDVRRGVTSVGPHRDEIGFTIDGFAARSEASQGEQRTLALALRLAGHRLITERLGEPPLLLLDDVLSELDPNRARALIANLPPGQTLITSASGLPPDTVADHTLSVTADTEGITTITDTVGDGIDVRDNPIVSLTDTDQPEPSEQV